MMGHSNNFGYYFELKIGPEKLSCIAEQIDKDTMSEVLDIYD